MSAQINKLYDQINKSNLTLIGYSYKDEMIKDKLISKLNPYSIESITDGFSLTSYIRNIKINEVLSSDSYYGSKFLVVDTSVISTPSKGNVFVGVSKAKFLRKLSEDLKVSSKLLGYRPIMTAPLYQSVSYDNGIHNFSGGSGPMYASDLVITFNNKKSKLQVIKNRNDDNFDISYDELKKFLYI